MSFAEKLAEDRRLIKLRALCEANGTQLNETVLRMADQTFGHMVGRDIVRSDLVWLEEQRLIRLEKLQTPSGEFWVAHLTESGEEVAQGRKHPGVARRVG